MGAILNKTQTLICKQKFPLTLLQQLLCLTGAVCGCTSMLRVRTSR
jgi:hypothetical protein